jgi:hypothetical protein
MGETSHIGQWLGSSFHDVNQLAGGHAGNYSTEKLACRRKTVEIALGDNFVL